MNAARRAVRLSALGGLLAVLIFVTPGASAAEPLECVVLEGETFCPDFGFTEQRPRAFASAPSRVGGEAGRNPMERAGALGGEPTGDMSRADYAAHLATLSVSRREAMRSNQISEARTAVGKVKLVDYLAEGEGIPKGFFAEYPSLGIVEGESQATSLRAEAHTSTSPATRVGPLALSPDPSRDCEYIMPNLAREQKKNNYCGPATMQMIDLGDGGENADQDDWVRRMGTTPGGTSIHALVAQLNKHTTWDVKAGSAFVVHSLDGKDENWFLAAHRGHIGLTKSPVVEHPKLLKRYFSYLAMDHGGHFQVGRGYSRTSATPTIGIIEPYNERTWSPHSGHETAGYRSVPLGLMFNATLANSDHRNIAFR